MPFRPSVRLLESGKWWMSACTQDIHRERDNKCQKENNPIYRSKQYIRNFVFFFPDKIMFFGKQKEHVYRPVHNGQQRNNYKA